MNDFKTKMAEHIKAIKGQPSQLDDVYKLQNKTREQQREIQKLKAEGTKQNVQYITVEPLKESATTAERIEYYSAMVRRKSNGWQGENKPKTLIQQRYERLKNANRTNY